MFDTYSGLKRWDCITVSYVYVTNVATVFSPQSLQCCLISSPVKV